MSNWSETDNALCAEFVFRDFKQAFAFMTECALHVEQLNHHPTWSNTWNKVEVVLQTHDAGNIVTQKDHELSERMSEVYKKYQA